MCKEFQKTLINIYLMGDYSKRPLYRWGHQSLGKRELSYWDPEFPA